MLILLVLLPACAPVDGKLEDSADSFACGPGTREEDGQCVVDDADTDTDTDSDTDTDTDTDSDTDADTDTDSDTDTDTDPDTDTGAAPDPAAPACGCAVSDSSVPGALMLLAPVLLALRRRREG